MMRNSVLASACIALSACSSYASETEVSQEGAAQASSASASSSAAGSSASSEVRAGGARKVAEANDTYEFDYAYPAAAGRIPALGRELDRRLEESRSRVASDASGYKQEAEDGGFPFRPYGSGTTWLTVADIPGWLSLSANIYSYTGGAHPNHYFDALLWDKQAGTVREVRTLFRSEAELNAAVQPAMCDALDRQRAEKRGAPVVRNQEDWSSACIGLDDTTIILGSSNGQSFDKVGFLIAPYAAGPYVEGNFEVTLPVTQALLNAVKPEFRSSFSLGS